MTEDTTLFESDDLLLRHHAGDAPAIAISFSSLRERRTGYGERYFRENGVSAYHFIAKWDHWWQPAAVDLAVAACVAHLGQHRAGREVLSLGTSMGAFGAALHSRALAVDRVLMIAPQFSADPRKPPGERRWAREAARIDFRNDDLAASASPSARKWVMYDPRSVDRGHADLLLALPNAVALPVFFSGHGVPSFLKQAKILKAVTAEALAGTLTPARHRALVRAGRRISGEYWFYLATAVGKRSPSAALPLFERAAQFAEDHRHHLSLAYAQIDALRPDLALRTLAGIEDVARDDVRFHRASSRAHRKLGNGLLATLHAERALAIAPNNEDLKRVHGDALALLAGLVAARAPAAST